MIPIYSAEVSPASVRGSVVIGSWQVRSPVSEIKAKAYIYEKICVALGIFLFVSHSGSSYHSPLTVTNCRGWSANLAMYRMGDLAWRLQIGSAFIPSVPLFFIHRCPGRKMISMFLHVLTGYRVTALSDSKTFVSLDWIKMANGMTV